jgi:hypothetical protein
MECKVDNDLLQGYLDNDLENIEMLIIQEHIKECKKCKTEITYLKLLMFEVSQIDDMDIDIPEEINLVREKVLYDIFNKKYEKKKASYIQGIKVFWKYIPGKELVNNGFEKSTKIVGNISMKALKFGFKRLRKGFNYD